jgi:hypothetical protein
MIFELILIGLLILAIAYIVYLRTNINMFKETKSSQDVINALAKAAISTQSPSTSPSPSQSPTNAPLPSPMN